MECSIQKKIQIKQKLKKLKEKLRKKGKEDRERIDIKCKNK